MLSIIIPVLNEEKYLPQLLTDLTRQIYRNFEVIVVDGQSDDKSVKLAKKFARRLPRLKIISSPKRHVCVQRNLGAKAAKAPILVFCDADCRISPEFLLGLRYRWETSGADILSFWLKSDIRNAQYDSIALAMNLFRELQNNLQPRFLLEALIAVKKSSFFRVGGFDESIAYAEGGQLIKKMTRLGYSSKIVHDPAFTFSLRRLRQMGLLKITASIAALELSKLFGKDYQDLLAKKLYPMTGGRQFVNSRKTKRFIDKIRQLMEKITRSF